MIKYSAFILAVLIFFSNCFADTFVHRDSGESFNGYALQKKKGNMTQVRTQGKEPQYIDLRDYNISYNHQGRKNQIAVFSIDSPIILECEAETFEKTIVLMANQGPLLILIEIDTPGGRIDLAMRLSSAITKIDNCRTIAFVNGGEHGGAISAGAAVALACNEVYMAGNTVIGAATLIAYKDPKDLNKTYREVAYEKASSFWQAYLASLAERRGRPGLLARAMVDKDIEVIEVSDGGKTLFIEPRNKGQEQHLVHTWSDVNLPLTLTAAEAVQCGIADKVVNSQRELLSILGTREAKILVNNEMQKARKEFEEAKRTFESLRKSLDLRYKQVTSGRGNKGRTLSILRGVINDYGTLVRLAKKYPDLHIDVYSLEKSLNSAKVYYENLSRTD